MILGEEFIRTSTKRNIGIHKNQKLPYLSSVRSETQKTNKTKDIMKTLKFN